MRDTQRRTLHVCWYDPATRQVLRRSLKTTDIEKAFAKVRSLEDRGIAGDPERLAEALLETVDALLDWHLPYTQKLASAETERIQIRRLKRYLGHRRIASLVLDDFEAFRDSVTDEGCSIGTVARTLSTLRSALSRAVKNRRIKRDDAPFVPAFADKNYLRSAPPKGRLITIEELARLIDEIAELHLLIFIIFLIHTGARPGALLDLTGPQIDLSRGRLALNRAGRLQTTKYRPTLPIPDTLRPWCEDMPDGHLITWRGKPLKKMRRAFASAAANAKLPGQEAPYSVRHLLARYMRENSVPLEQVAVWLGHVQPPTSPETTLFYSPDSPDYLLDAKAAVEKFVRKLNELTERDLLKPPGPLW